MFFTSELLEKRDSGLGLLWLAATVGSKSSFSKINKRSILSANISQLCLMITEPPEPLALRLSSNLMIGVVRVHRAQADMVYTDVMTTLTSLKRAGIDFTSDTQMQGPISTRKELITLADVPMLLDFDLLEPNWNEIIFDQPIPMSSQFAGTEDDAIIAEGSEVGRSSSSNNMSTTEHRRRLHLLDEPITNDDFDLLDISGGGSGPSDDPFFDDLENQMLEEGLDLGVDFGDGDEPLPAAGFLGTDGEEPFMTPGAHQVEQPFGDDDAMVMDEWPQDQGLYELEDRAPIPPLTMGHASSSPPHPGQISPEPPNNSGDALIESQIGSSPPPAKTVVTKKKPSEKRKIQALLDPVIELSDAKLHEMRDGYDKRIKEEHARKKKKMVEEVAAKRVNDMMFSLLGFEDSSMTKWTSDLLKIQYDANARNGRNRSKSNDSFAEPGIPLRRRGRKVFDRADEDEPLPGHRARDETDQSGWMDWTEQDIFNQQTEEDVQVVFGDDDPVPRERSSSEGVEQGRHANSSRPSSRAGSSVHNLNGTSKNRTTGSSKFPWNDQDDAVAGSGLGSQDDFGFGGFASSDGPGMRFSSIDPAMPGKTTPLRPVITTPVGTGKVSSINLMGDGQAPISPLGLLFGEQEEPATQGDDTQRTDMSVFTLQQNMEKESFKFLQHISNIAQASDTQRLVFTEYLKPEMTTRRTAAAAFYHLLELTTKRHIQLEQTEPFGEIVFTIVDANH